MDLKKIHFDKVGQVEFLLLKSKNYLNCVSSKTITCYLQFPSQKK